MQHTLDVIIPVYNAYDDLRLCLDSVLRTTAPQHRLILIDDGSPDSRIADYFAELRNIADPRLLLLRNDVNLGFVGTVNRGMAQSRNDVVLLNSDTIVTTGWLEKLCRCADSDLRIGTITPFSNNAEICSFPNFCEDNPLPQGMDEEDVNRAIEAAAVPIYPDIPTAVGFCMFIRRDLLNKIGLFDADTFRLGYGEENDFCMRAVAAGWRNVLCDDTFIEHTGSRSFDTKKQALAEQNMPRLLAKHPDYMQQVMAFIAADPIKPIRQLALSFLALAGPAGARPGVLHITHARGGGTEQHIRSLMHGKDGYRHYMLVTSEDVWQLKDGNGGALVIYQFQRQPDQLWVDFLGGICASFHIRLCHVHHLSGCQMGLLEALRTLDIPYGFSVHDFYLACPTINLLDASGIYCGGETDALRCQACLNKQADFRGIDIASWRAAHADFIERAVFVTAPSNWAAATFRRYFPQHDIQVIPHGMDLAANPDDALPSAFLLPRDARHSIGVLGAIGPVKGARQLEQLVARSRERKLALRWVVVGYLDRQFQPYQSSDAALTVHGAYSPQHVAALLDHYRIDMVAFPSAGPETFCYTLTEAWAAGRPALVPPIGALDERVKMSGAGWVMHDWKDMDAILDDIVSIFLPENQADFARKKQLALMARVIPVQEMIDATEKVYHEVKSGQSLTVHAPLSRRTMYGALLKALGNKPRPLSVGKRMLMRLLHLGLRLRYTMLGRKLYRIVPVRWQQILKQRLLDYGQYH